MKTFLASTAIALVMANGAFAESHVNADGTMSTDTTTEAPAADTMAPDATATDSMTDSTATEMSDQTSDTDAASTTETMAAPMDTTGMAAPAMTVDGYATVGNMDVTAEELTGIKVFGPDDDNVGEIGDLVVGTDGMISEVIVDVGGFLGLGEKPVALPFDAVQIMKQTDGDDMRAYVAMTEDQLKELPKYEAPADASTSMDAAPADSTMDAAPADTTMEPAPETAPANN